MGKGYRQISQTVNHSSYGPGTGQEEVMVQVMPGSTVAVSLNNNQMALEITDVVSTGRPVILRIKASYSVPGQVQQIASPFIKNLSDMEIEFVAKVGEYKEKSSYQPRSRALRLNKG